jgi:hypothetical protein
VDELAWDPEELYGKPVITDTVFSSSYGLWATEVRIPEARAYLISETNSSRPTTLDLRPSIV